jgi:hypothetical protein
MSFFGSIGKFIGKVAKVALPVVKFGSSFIPGVGGIVGKVLSSGIGVKAQKLVHTGEKVSKAAKAFPGVASQPPPFAAGAHVLAVKHARSAHKVAGMMRVSTARKRRKPSVLKRRPTTKRRKTRLKFGSPAWRKKFLKKKR